MTRPRPGGFTLIELLAASTLAALLMLVLFQVIGSLGRTKAALADRPLQQRPWTSDLLDQIRWDLANADEIESKRNHVALIGHGSLQRRSLNGSHEPVTVEYGLERRGGRSCLVRRQSARATLSNAAGWSDVLCVDVDRFEISRVNSSSASFNVRIDGPSQSIVNETLVIK